MAAARVLEVGRKRRRRGTSISRLLAQKKSVPSIGFCTSAKRKLCTTRSPGKERDTDLVPKVRIEDPFAAVRSVVVGVLFCEGVVGKTDTSAPLSTRKERCWRRQNTDSAPSRGDNEERDDMAGGGEA